MPPSRKGGGIGGGGVPFQCTHWRHGCCLVLKQGAENPLEMDLFYGEEGK